MASSVKIIQPTTSAVTQPYTVQIDWVNQENVDMVVNVYRDSTTVSPPPFPPAPPPASGRATPAAATPSAHLTVTGPGGPITATASKSLLELGAATHGNSGSYTAYPLSELVRCPCTVVITAKLQATGSNETSPHYAIDTKTITVS